ncbi:fumarylacetoacetate hydrolase family protein [Falsiroseomonas selenitidurans]|uniref:Fumarylacetoacetate hydrolase family protein n=1 Tax=Falsiroseomonas selenitidurans TaxID=2716335 RepID=A0ABX1E2C5_9PROT|nr:fumarylacetoacetate hydrolase family protein [Falsiroseomonas selenitidurans]NKC30928.1 fumarylacetoacetate hydrolase family protein [Falsiroseomonas selenitidurans]
MTQALPHDLAAGSFALRLMTPEGPVVHALQGGEAFDMTPAFGTASAWMNSEDPVAAIRARGVPVALDLPAALANAHHAARDPAKPWLLAPVDLQVIKAAGVTYVRSMLERVIEERCRGDASQAETIRAEVRRIIGDDLANLVPGSPEAMAVKAALVAKGWWSQYLEVGIGADAEIFTKAPVLSAVGPGAKVGVHPVSQWSNPEPEAVMVVNAQGRIVGAALGNDVNLRDVEGRSALLLGRAKDNNAACSIGPLVRLFDESFTLEDVRQAELTLTITGRDGFALQDSGRIGDISRDPTDLVGQMIGAHHQYPDGAVLFLGTPFSPSKDRGAPGMGFTHHPGDVVRIATPRLGALENEVDRTDSCPPWAFGIGALMASLARRGHPA